MSVVEILKVKIDNISKKDALGKIKSFLEKEGVSHVVTVNPELILEAQRNEKFFEILSNAHLSVADGMGVSFAIWKSGKIPQSRICGSDLIWNILELANRKKMKIFLVANKDGLSCWREVRKEIKKKFPFLKIDGMNLGRGSRFSSIKNNEKLINSHVLLCNFGAPHQEFFINSINGKNNIRLAMGVGGSFDFISRKIKRAPSWMRGLGLEWLWRLFVQPRRIKRIFEAVVLFPIRVIINK